MFLWLCRACRVWRHHHPKSCGTFRGYEEVSYDAWGSSGSCPVCRHGHVPRKMSLTISSGKGYITQSSNVNTIFLGLDLVTDFLFFWKDVNHYLELKYALYIAVRAREPARVEDRALQICMKSQPKKKKGPKWVAMPLVGGNRQHVIPSCPVTQDSHPQVTSSHCTPLQGNLLFPYVS